MCARQRLCMCELSTPKLDGQFYSVIADNFSEEEEDVLWEMFQYGEEYPT
jgi:hypothetical protein